jgi:hypothetical protein
MIGAGVDADRLKMAKELDADVCVNAQETDNVGEVASEVFRTEGLRW